MIKSLSFDRRHTNMMLSRFILGVATISILTTYSYAYERVDVRKRVDERKMAHQYTHKSNIRKRSVEIEEDEELNMRNLLMLEPDEDLQPVNSESSSTGVNVRKYKETYRNIPIFDAIVTVETTQSGTLTGDASGTLIQKISEDIHGVKPSLTKDQILKLATEIEGDHHRLSELGGVNIELWIYPHEDKKARLVYFVQYLIEGGVPKRPSMILDSFTGEILLRYNDLETAVVGSNRRSVRSPPYFSCHPDAIKGVGGNEKIGKVEYGAEPFCIRPEEKCYLQNAYVRIVNMRDSENETISTRETVSFSCNKYPNDDDTAPYSPALDAFFYGTVVAKMYSDWVGGSPLEEKIVLRVHYGTNYENAFWNGENVTLGDGGFYFYPLVSLDVVGHEIGHGVVERYSKLMYLRQSGGINEAFADIMGETAVAYFSSNKVKLDWKIGAEITKLDPYMRSFEKPDEDGNSISHVENFTLSVLPHFSSGIFRLAFYTLVTKQNIPIKNAFRAFALANKLYWHHMSTFQDAGCLVIKAAYDLGHDVNAYRKAFDVVGISKCNVEAHIRSLVSGREYTDILVSNDSRPLFKFTTPLWVANVTALVRSDEGDIGILVLNSSITNNPFAFGEQTIQFTYEGGAVIFIKLTTTGNVEERVNLTVSYTCNLSWEPALQQPGTIEYYWDYCVFLYDCDRDKYLKTNLCPK